MLRNLKVGETFSTVTHKAQQALLTKCATRLTADGTKTLTADYDPSSGTTCRGMELVEELRDLHSKLQAATPVIVAVADAGTDPAYVIVVLEGLVCVCIIAGATRGGQMPAQPATGRDMDPKPDVPARPLPCPLGVCPALVAP